MLEQELKRLNENLEKNNNNNNITKELKRLNKNLEVLVTYFISRVKEKEKEIEVDYEIKDIKVIKEKNNIKDTEVTVDIKNVKVVDKEVKEEVKEKVKEEVKPKKLTKKRLIEQVEMLRLRVIDLIRRNITTTVEIKKILTSQGYENFNAVQEIHLKDWEDRIIQWENTLN